MDFDLAFENCLKHWFVHGDHSLKEGKVGKSLVEFCDIPFLEQISINHSFLILVPQLR
jgi:hypothetical protein